MKQIVRFLAVIILFVTLCISTSPLFAQVTYLVNSLQLVGPSGTLTLNYTGTGPGTLTLTESSSLLPLGTLPGQTLRWNGASWETSEAILNGGISISVPTADLTLGTGTYYGNGSGLTNLDAGDLTGTINDARLSSNVPLLGADNLFTGFDNEFFGIVTALAFEGGGLGITSLDADAISTGTVDDDRLSPNIPLLDADNFFTGFDNEFFGTVTAFGFEGGGLGITSLDADAISTGTVDDDRLSPNVPLLDANNFFSGFDNEFFGSVTAFSFEGNGSGLTDLAADEIVNGTLDDDRLSLNIPRLDASNTFTGTTNTFNAVVANTFTGDGSALTGISASLTLPYSQTQGNVGYLFEIVNDLPDHGRGARFAVTGGSTQYFALTAESTSDQTSSGAVLATAVDGPGVQAQSSTNTGVIGSSSSGTGVVGSSTNGAGGQFSGVIGVQITAGTLVGSYAAISSGDQIPSTVTTVFVSSDGTSGNATASLPFTGTNGQIIHVGTDDPDGLTIGSSTVLGDSMAITLVYVGDGWRTTN